MSTQVQKALEARNESGSQDWSTWRNSRLLYQYSKLVFLRRERNKIVQCYSR